MTEASFWWVHTGQVETFQGSGAYGDTYADPATVSCWVEGETKTVTDSQGSQVESMTVVRGPITDRDKFTPQSRFTSNGQTARVVTLAWFDSGSLDIGLDHYEARLI